MNREGFYIDAIDVALDKAYANGRLDALDDAWVAVKHLTNKNVRSYLEEGINMGLGEALEAIEELGGTDPGKKRVCLCNAYL